MLEELHVTNLALIRDASIEPARGLTALTGETGAGKSALLSAIKLLIGERASGDQVRDGAEALCVEGAFTLPDDGDGFPDGHVASRRVTREGRSRCSLDGSLATVSQLAQTIGSAVDLCGQHDHQRLLVPANHLGMLDAWAAETVAPVEEEYARAWKARSQAAAELERVLSASGENGARVDDARFAISRIEEVGPKEGEYEELEALLPRLEHAESLAQGANAAYEALSGEGGALESLSAAADALEAVSSYDAVLGEAARSLREAAYPVEDAARELRRYRDDVDFDPEALARADERMGQLVGLMRSFGPRMQDVFRKLEESRSLVSAVDGSQELERRARAALDEAEAALVARARALSQARAAAAPLFASSVTEQMGRLEMGGAELVADMSPLPRRQWTRSGGDKVEFMYRPGPGLALRPFSKIASGGEVSRVMLAIKVALGARDDVDTLVFDEIDAGVGGSTARSVAAVLDDLARTHQVVVVTHLAQIAVTADRQYVVSKAPGEADGMLETSIRLVEGEERVLEVARMLSGDESESSVEHARTLLAERRG